MKIAVTGISGFLASHVALQLLNKGHQVVGTVRSESKGIRIRAVLDNALEFDEANLTLVESDLTSDAGWSRALTGCDYVIHVASPFPPVGPVAEDELIVPAREGTLRVLRSARDANVSRVVITSSFGAIGYGHERDHPRFTEEDWTNIDASGVSPYIKSKTLAEMAAWEFAEREASGMEVVVVNPTGIFGPALSPDLSSSLLIVQRLLEGKMKICPNLYFGLVDVRDAADLHVKAMLHEDAAGQRFIGVAGDCISMFEAGQILKRNLEHHGDRVPAFATPDWVMRLLSKFNPEARAVAHDIGNVRLASNEKARRILGWRPRSNEEALVSTAKSLIELKLLSSE